MHRSRLTLALLAVLSTVAGAQRARAGDGSAVTGSYEVHWARRAACWLQVGPVAADTVRVQLECSRGAPSYNLGLVDERLPLRRGAVRYETAEYGDRCVIAIRFAGARAVVRQEGTDAACGFGRGVYASGTYRRVSRRMPPFSLGPRG